MSLRSEPVVKLLMVSTVAESAEFSSWEKKSETSALMEGREAADGEPSADPSVELSRMLVVWWVERWGGAACWIPMDWAMLICIEVTAAAGTDLPHSDTLGGGAPADNDAAAAGLEAAAGVAKPEMSSAADSADHFVKRESRWYSKWTLKSITCLNLGASLSFIVS